MRPIWINYLYFGSLFALLVLLSCSSIFLREPIGGSHIFFFFYSIGEALCEVILFIVAGWLIRRFLPPRYFLFYMGLTFFCFLYHFADFMMDRILNLSVVETLQFIFDESLDNFLSLLEASGLPLWMWLGFLAVIAAVPLCGIFLYRLTEWVGTKRPLGVRLDYLLQTLFCIPAALFFWDATASRFLPSDVHPAFVKSLPWKFTFLQPESPKLILPALAQPKSEAQKRAWIEETTLSLPKRPNIYLIIAESLRRDVIVPEIAPHLSQFAASCVPCLLTLANANATMISWFSLFHSEHPLYWSHLQRAGWQSGSPALQLLKKLGYRIHVLSAAHLVYYNMDSLLFGADLASIQYFPHMRPKEAYESDAETLDALEKTLQDPASHEGQCFILFWDTTHFDYSWPKDKPPVFSPVASESNYFKALQSKENIEAIKNRYRNAVHTLDSLFARFLTLIPHRQESAILFTGDHGEEFFDHGHLFHLSQLSDVQTEVPLFLQLPRAVSVPPKMMAHMDIFPTLIDALSGQTDATAGLLEGQSLYKENRWPYALIARFNASRTPREICLHNGAYKLTARFDSLSTLFHAPILNILSIRTRTDQVIEKPRAELPGWVENEFGSAFDKFFPKQ